MKYAKMIPPLLGAVAMVILTGVINAIQGDHLIDAQEGIQMIIQGLSVVAVWGAANVPGWEKGKAVQAAIFVALNLLVSLVLGGMDLTEWLNLGIALLAAFGVAKVPQPPSTQKASVVGGKGEPQ